jgi:hypothetical protein
MPLVMDSPPLKPLRTAPYKQQVRYCSVSGVREALPAPPGGRLPGAGQLCAGQVQRRSHGLQRLQPVLLLGELPEGDEPAGQAGQHLLRHHGDPPVLPYILHLQRALQVGKLILYFITLSATYKTLLLCKIFLDMSRTRVVILYSIMFNIVKEIFSKSTGTFLQHAFICKCSILFIVYCISTDIFCRHERDAVRMKYLFYVHSGLRYGHNYGDAKE